MGRIIIIVLAVAGLLPLLGDAKALDATTVSGTIVLGLGPPIFALMFIDGYRPLTFHVPFWWCVAAFCKFLSHVEVNVAAVFIAETAPSWKAAKFLLPICCLSVRITCLCLLISKQDQIADTVCQLSVHNEYMSFLDCIWSQSFSAAEHGIVRCDVPH